MPSRESTVPDLITRGPLIPIRISWPTTKAESYRVLGRPVPNPVVVDALVDTGASCTAVTPSVAKRLDLRQIGVVEVAGINEVKPCPLYVVRLVPLAGTDESPRRVFDPWPVVGTEPALDYECILGRDVLDGAVFTYDGPGKCFDISFQVSSDGRS